MRLATEWGNAHPLPNQVPTVPNQLTTTIINPAALFPTGYNPSVILSSGRRFMAYRYHAGNGWETSLAIADLDDKFNVISNRKIALPGRSNEDPRLFEYQGVLWMAYVETRSWVAGTMPNCCIRYGKLIEGNEWQVDGQFLVKYGKNVVSGPEKNWVPFEWGDRLFFTYQIWPEQIVIEVQGDDVIGEFKSPGSWWKWGQIRGGTPPIMPFRDQRLRFFHSRLDNESPIRHRYYVGALIQETKPPFKVLSVSKRPILRGSEIDTLTPDEKKACRCWNPNTAFPLGVIQAEDGWFLSVGINHGRCGLVKITEKDLWL